MVRLKARQVELKDVDKGNFNSNMVRLKVDHSRIDTSTHADFNSNMVRLKECEALATRILYFNFNSNMVRLKVAVTESGTPVALFQFLYGAIKSVSSHAAIAF